ncbi:MAG: metallophosphoesterase family protein [Saprospiraceae bacterium]|nr:metallophosphoesterase family protein [Saprospiraceae bacterium]
MKRIGLLSDTHGYLDESIFEHFANCDEIWHAGDIGNVVVADTMEAFKPFKAVYGNIDDRAITSIYPRDARFEVEGMDVLMTHIGGYPGRYNRRILQIMIEDPPQIFICGHSHILKVIYDKKFSCLHMNPGACGRHGMHKVRTLLRFEIDLGRISKAEVIELGPRTFPH